MNKIWHKAFTYKPKIPAVWGGKCGQTIRFITVDDPNFTNKSTARRKAVQVGDEIEWFQWAGRPYWSKWLNRLIVTVTKVQVVKMYKEGICFNPLELRSRDLIKWDSPEMDIVADLDFVEGGGKGMGELFNDNHRLSGWLKMDTHPDMKKWFQIITWDKENIRRVS